MLLALLTTACYACNTKITSEENARRDINLSYLANFSFTNVNQNEQINWTYDQKLIDTLEGCYNSGIISRYYIQSSKYNFIFFTLPKSYGTDYSSVYKILDEYSLSYLMGSSRRIFTYSTAPYYMSYCDAQYEIENFINLYYSDESDRFEFNQTKTFSMCQIMPNDNSIDILITPVDELINFHNPEFSINDSAGDYYQGFSSGEEFCSLIKCLFIIPWNNKQESPNIEQIDNL